MGTCSSNTKTHKKSSTSSYQYKDELSLPKHSNKKSKNYFKFNIGDFVIHNKNKITSEYKILYPPIGKGTYGEVRKALHFKTNTYRAIKMVSKKDLSLVDKKHLLKEITLLKKMDHPNIVKVFEFFETDFYYHVVMEYLEGRELFGMLTNKEFAYDEQTICGIMQQLLSAIQFMHTNGIMHRDLKSENVIYTGKQIVLIDFGNSKLFNSSKKQKDLVGTSFYIAPEVIKGSYNEKCDVWSAGIVLYVMLTGKAPFRGNENEVFFNILNEKYVIPIAEIPNISEQAKNFLKYILTFNYKKRPSPLELLKHDWFKNVNNDSIYANKLKNAAENIAQFQFKYKLQEAIYMFLINTMVTRNEYTDIVELFQEMDINKDGVLTKEELILGFKKAGKLYNDQEIEDMFHEMDKDGNGVISFGEYLAASIDKNKVLSEKKIVAAFKLFDKDKNGKISIDEFQDVFQHDNILSNNWIEMIKEVDLNGDGEISFEEFKILLMKILEK